MKAVILAGGEGTRLRPLTFAIPKPLIPVGEKPILEIIIRRLKKFGVKDFILSVGYKAHLLETYFQDGKKFGVRIHYVHEEKPLGTAGSLKLVAKHSEISKQTSFLAMNGDILTQLNFRKFIDFHLKNNADLTVGIKKFVQKLPYGILKINKDSVKAIKEKPEESYDISAGIYLIKASSVKYIPDNKSYSMPELIMALIKNNKRVIPYVIKEDWLAIEHLHHIEEINYNLEKWIKE